MNTYKNINIIQNYKYFIVGDLFYYIDSENDIFLVNIDKNEIIYKGSFKNIEYTNVDINN